MAKLMKDYRNRYELRSLPSQRVRCSISSNKSSHVKKRKTVPFVEDHFEFAMSVDEDEYMSLIRDKPSDSEDEEVEEGSAQSYAIIAVDRYKGVGNSVDRYKGVGNSVDPYKGVGNFELMDAGPLAAGNFSGGRIYHLNYKAKNTDVPGAPLQTFFCEMTKTKERGLAVHYNICLGPSDSLPEKANTHGCLYCLSHNIHHHFNPITFRNGGLLFSNTLDAEISRLTEYIEKGMKRKNFSPSFKHPGIVYLGRKTGCTKEQFAKVALNMYNLKQHTNFEFVRIGFSGRALVSIGMVYHLNFEAKRSDVPDASMHTFFAQVINKCSYYFAHFCKCLGKSDSLPDEVEMHGCQYCLPRYPYRSPRVHHPPGPGYLTGREHYGHS